MTPNELVAIIPEVLLYIVPGFIVLKIVEHFTPRKQQPQLETILWSLFYSFLVSLAVGCFRQSPAAPYAAQLNSFLGILSKNADVCAYVIMSILLGLVIVKVIHSPLGDKIAWLFNKNMDSGDDLWFEVLKANKNVSATVYLKNNMFYIGWLANFTSDPNDNNKMIVLTDYRAFIRADFVDGTASDNPIQWHCRELTGEHEGHNDRILIKLEDILTIELCDPLPTVSNQSSSDQNAAEQDPQFSDAK